MYIHVHVHVHVTQNMVWDMLPQEFRPSEVASGAIEGLYNVHVHHVQCTLELHVEIEIKGERNLPLPAV